MRIKGVKIAQTILRNLATAGGYLFYMMEPGNIQSSHGSFALFDKYKSEYNAQARARKLYCAFYYLKKKGLIDINYRGKQMYISLTEEGQKRAGKYKIDGMKIKKPKKWDKKWRVLIFDIKDKQKIKREALRGKIKELDMLQLQKSVWVYPYDFTKEMKLLRKFFGLTETEMNLIEASKIEDENRIREYFGL
jgi:DNA-binding transcriptional regulator PaaX